MATSTPNYLPHRHAKQRCLRRGDPRTSAPRRAGCEVHKSGSARGVLRDEGPYSTPGPSLDFHPLGAPKHRGAAVRHRPDAAPLRTSPRKQSAAALVAPRRNSPRLREADFGGHAKEPGEPLLHDERCDNRSRVCDLEHRRSLRRANAT